MKVTVVRWSGGEEFTNQSAIRKSARLPLGEQIYFGGSPYFVSGVGYEGLNPVPVVHLERMYLYE